MSSDPTGTAASLDAGRPFVTVDAAPVDESGMRRPWVIAAVYTAAVFASAFLLFLVQPMFGKMVLPLLGGSPAVWNTCMLFFQLALLSGYLYADVSSRFLPVRRQWIVHLVLLAAAFATLPISLAGASPEGGEAPIPWLLSTMLVAVGPAFAVLAATGPMLQRWFSRTSHPSAASPYHLYAASNLGSMLALLAYPFLVEPRLRVADQSFAWSVGFVLLAGLMVTCGLFGWARDRRTELSAVPETAAASPTTGDRARWVALAFVPSSLLLAVTTYITTDLTPAPLFWVIPLALYLLTFTLVFARRQLFRHGWMLAAQPVLIAATLFLIQRTEHLDNPRVAVPVHLVMLFTTAMVCHGELARRRPDVRHLTEYYLWISIGGALGGVFNVLVAPVLFSRLWEYPLVLVLACLLRPWPPSRQPLRMHLRWALYAVGFSAILVMLTRSSEDALPRLTLVILVLTTTYLISAGLSRSPMWLTVCIAAVAGAKFVADVRDSRAIYVDRSFYGQYRINQTASFRILQHGSTLHGAQNRDVAHRRDPITYYLREGPVGDIFRTIGFTNTPRRVAVVGLGTGTTAAYANEGEDWTFYEIDPGIERIARDTTYFTYLADSPAASTRIVIGDARLSLQREEDRRYDLIVLDAFSSDAIPVHLLTREAMQVYLSRLAPGGRIAVHISNRYLDLEPVVASLARDNQLVAVAASGPPNASRGLYENSSNWIVLARQEADIAGLLDLVAWSYVVSIPEFRSWSDDFSSLWTVMKW